MAGVGRLWGYNPSLLCAVLNLVAHLTLPIDLDSITVERARALSGRAVVASFVAGEPFAYPDYGITTIGAGERDDGAEHGAILRGVRYDMKAGELVRVFGVLEVIDHPPVFVGGVLVEGWVEVRVGG